MKLFRLWSSVLLSDSGKFWMWAVLNVDPGLYPSQGYDLINSRILPIIPKIRISPITGPNIVESLLVSISQGEARQLKEITISSATGSLDPEIFSRAAVKLQILRADLSSVQLEAIFTRSAATQDSRLRKLYFYHSADISGMDPEILCQALLKLKSCPYWVKLSADQVLALFSRIKESPDLRPTELLLWWDVSMVPPDVFAGALSRLERVKILGWSRVTPSQLESLFMLMISNQEEAGGSKLKQLKFHYTDLTSVSPEVLVGAIQRLENVAVWIGKMTADQITAILTMLKGNQKGRLKYVQIFRPSIFGGSVSPTLLQEAKLNTSVKLSVNI